MIIAGVNFTLHYRLLHRQFSSVAKDIELRFYLMVIVVATILIAISVFDGTVMEAQTGQAYSTVSESVRKAIFQAVAIITTTGFGTADYELWPPLAVGVLFFMFFVGGMAGSTAGGVKVVRHVLLYKHTHAEIKRLVHPQAIIPIRLSGKVVPQDVMRNVLSFIVLYVATVGAGSLLMALFGMDLLTSIGAAISCVGNVGPAFGTLGPAENYAHIPMIGKWVLAGLMMLGRLEIFTVLVLFVPAFWRR
jgi:trk system potassium uptake protein TrkH